DDVDELLQTRYALQFNRLSQLTGHPQSTTGNADIELVFERPRALNILPLHLCDGTILFAFKMQPGGWNLFKVNFHRPILSQFIGQISEPERCWRLAARN